MEYLHWLRGKVGTERVLVPSTACIVLNARGEILLQLRADMSVWGCPGGIMDIGETVSESAARELLEETGLVAESLTLFGIYSGTRFFATYPNGDRTAVVQTVFLVQKTSGELRIDEESKELCWFDPGALPESLAPHHEPFLRHYVEWRRGERGIPVVE
jgi:ADP-ribose pyrophosphatase YjhB (NUDIX family)